MGELKSRIRMEHAENAVEREQAGRQAISKPTAVAAGRQAGKASAGSRQGLSPSVNP